MNPKHILISTLLSLLGGTAASVASFDTGFETSSGYGTDTTVIGVHDTDAPAGANWNRLFGSSSVDSRITSSTANPQTGLQALRLDGNGTAALSASVNLSAALSMTNPVHIHFGMALDNISAGTGNQAQVYFGAATTTSSYWFSTYYTDGFLYLGVNTPSGDYNSGVNLGAYTDFSQLGEYITFDVTIDPTEFTYTSVVLTGTVSGAVDKTATVQAYNNGTLPHLHDLSPDMYFSFVTGSNDTITADFDNVSVSSVPEPATVAFLFLTGAWLLLRKRRR